MFCISDWAAAWGALKRLRSNLIRACQGNWQHDEEAAAAAAAAATAALHPKWMRAQQVEEAKVEDKNETWKSQ